MNLFYKRVPDVISQRLDDSIILFHTRTDQIYELNNTCAAIWESIEQYPCPKKLANALAHEYGVEPHEISNDVQVALEQLCSYEIVKKQ